jgi:hypothetical protein
MATAQAKPLCLPSQHAKGIETMSQEASNEIASCMGLIDSVLRTLFPDDYDARCMYAAFGLSSLLRQSGLDARIVGGDFLAFVVSKDGRQANLQGFGQGSDSALPSHFWVESSGRLLDLGPHYLPRKSSFPAAAIPGIALPLSQSPLFLRYRAKIRYEPDVQLASDDTITGRMQAFLKECNSRWKKGVRPTLPTWIFSDKEALQRAMTRRDPWAHGATQFARRARIEELPF